MNILIGLLYSVQEILGCCHKRQEGQATVETFILISSFLFVLFFAVIQISIIFFTILTGNEAVFMSNRSAIVQKNMEDAKKLANFSFSYILSRQINKNNIFYYSIKLTEENSIYTMDLTYHQRVMFLGKYFYKGKLVSKMGRPCSSDFLEVIYPGAKKWEN